MELHHRSVWAHFAKKADDSCVYITRVSGSAVQTFSVALFAFQRRAADLADDHLHTSVVTLADCSLPKYTCCVFTIIGELVSVRGFATINY